MEPDLDLWHCSRGMFLYLCLAPEWHNMRWKSVRLLGKIQKIFGETKKKVTVWDKYMPEMRYRHYETLLLQFISGLYLTVLLVAQPLCWLIGFTLFTLLQTQKACVFFEDEETTICQVIYSFTKHMLHKVCTGKVSFPASETLLVAFLFVWSKSVKCQTWWIITTLRLTLIEK